MFALSPVSEFSSGSASQTAACWRRKLDWPSLRLAWESRRLRNSCLPNADRHAAASSASFSHLLTWIERAGAFGIREPKGFLTDRCLEIDWLTKT